MMWKELVSTVSTRLVESGLGKFRGRLFEKRAHVGSIDWTEMDERSLIEEC